MDGSDVIACELYGHHCTTGWNPVRLRYSLRVFLKDTMPAICPTVWYTCLYFFTDLNSSDLGNAN